MAPPQWTITTGLYEFGRPIDALGHSLRPALPCGDGEERQQSPDDVVVVELVPLPLPPLDLLLVLPVVDVVTPEVTQ